MQRSSRLTKRTAVEQEPEQPALVLRELDLRPAPEAMIDRAELPVQRKSTLNGRSEVILFLPYTACVPS